MTFLDQVSEFGFLGSLMGMHSIIHDGTDTRPPIHIMSPWTGIAGAFRCGHAYQEVISVCAYLATNAGDSCDVPCDTSKCGPRARDARREVIRQHGELADTPSTTKRVQLTIGHSFGCVDSHGLRRLYFTSVEYRWFRVRQAAGIFVIAPVQSESGAEFLKCGE